MSGLDKFMKTPGKSSKKAVAKDKENKVKPKTLPKRTEKQGSQKFDEEIPPDEFITSPPERDESEEISEFQEHPPDVSIEEEDPNIPQESPSPARKFSKFHLKCTSKKCNYQRILMKPMLSSSDLTCPKCGNQMRQK